jgi:hypothetical protein
MALTLDIAVTALEAAIFFVRKRFFRHRGKE